MTDTGSVLHPPAGMHCDNISILVCQSQRKVILASPCDMAEMHRLLNNLPILKASTADDLAQEAVAACKASPPKALLKKHGLQMLR